MQEKGSSLLFFNKRSLALALKALFSSLIEKNTHFIARLLYY